MGNSEMINLDYITNKFNDILGGKAFVSEKKENIKENIYLISDLLPYLSFDEENKLFINDNSIGFLLDATPLIGASEETINDLSNLFSDSIPLGCTIQFINWGSPNTSNLLEFWSKPRKLQGGVYEKMAQKRLDYFKNANKKSIFQYSPFTIKDFKLIVSVSISLNKKEDLVSKVL